MQKADHCCQNNQQRSAFGDSRQPVRLRPGRAGYLAVPPLSTLIFISIRTASPVCGVAVTFTVDSPAGVAFVVLTLTLAWSWSAVISAAAGSIVTPCGSPSNVSLTGCLKLLPRSI